MSINLEIVLGLLLLSIVGGIPSAVGQNALSNTTTASDIIDLVDNVTESEGGGGEEEEIEEEEEEIESPLPLEALSNTTTASDIIDLVDNVTESEGGGGEEEEIEDLSSPT